MRPLRRVALLLRRDGAQRESPTGEAADGSRPLARSASCCARPRPARLAYQSWSRTYPFSVARNRDAAAAQDAASSPGARCASCTARGDGWLEQLPRAHAPARTRAPSRQRRRWRASALARRRRARVEKALHIEQWFLAYALRQRHASTRATSKGFTRLVPPKDRDWADPFVHREERPLLHLLRGAAAAPPARRTSR